MPRTLGEDRVRAGRREEGDAEGEAQAVDEPSVGTHSKSGKGPEVASKMGMVAGGAVVAKDGH